MVESQLSYCGKLVKQQDNDRFLCALFANTQEREKLFTLLAFNQEIARIPQMVNEPMAGMIRLQWWRDAIEGIYNNDPRNHEAIQALYPLVQNHSLSRIHLDALINAREDDLDTTSPQDVETLLGYVENTSSALFILMLEALDIKDTTSIEAAKHLGIAWALTGMLRSIKHPQTKRLMLPELLLAEQNITKDEIRAGKNLERTKPIAKTLTDLAIESLKKAREHHSSIPKNALPVFLPALFADTYLKRLRKADYDLFHTDLELHRSFIQLKLLFNASLKRF